MIDFVIVNLGKERYLSPYFEKENNRYILPYYDEGVICFKKAQRLGKRVKITPSKTTISADDLLITDTKMIKVKGTDIFFDNKTIIE
ncbi:MAG: hypothetical protein RR334_02120 [Clostridia bacterium]